MFAKNLNIEGVKDSSIVHISFRHADPGVAADVVDALLTAYFGNRQALFRAPESGILQAQLDKRKKAFEDVGARITAFQDKLGIGDFNVTLEGLNQRDIALAREIDRLNGEIAAAKVALKALQAGRKTKSLLAEIRQSKAALGGLEAQLALARSQIAAVRSQQRTLLSHRATHDALQQQREAAEQGYVKILAKIEDAQTNAALDAAGLANVKVIQEPAVPARPVSLPPLTLAGLATGLAFLTGLAILVTLSATSTAPLSREAAWLERAEPTRAPPLPVSASIRLLPMPQPAGPATANLREHRLKRA
jgi:uncharacterized protein involved in exopolysaccharide biosynthesis